MKDNKIIAEFMGVPQGKHTHFMVEPFALESYADVDDLKYDASWDWLIPVVQECLTKGEDEDEWDAIYNAVGTIDIEDIYQAVVEFIKTYNNQDTEDGKAL